MAEARNCIHIGKHITLHKIDQQVVDHGGHEQQQQLMTMDNPSQDSCNAHTESCVR
jgi:hypothetical protein